MIQINKELVDNQYLSFNKLLEFKSAKIDNILREIKPKESSNNFVVTIDSNEIEFTNLELTQLKSYLLDSKGNSYNKIKYICFNSNLKEIINDYHSLIKHSSNFKKFWDATLSYSSFNTSSIFSRHDFLTKLGVNVCPYCNRQTISSYKAKDKDKSTADADHYFIKTDFPILQLNLYNLIPSCNICNSKMKGISKKMHLHPYFDKETIKFKILYENFDDIFITKENIRYEFEAQKDFENIISEENGGENSINVFNLNNVYDGEISQMFELLSKIKKTMNNEFDSNERKFGSDNIRKSEYFDFLYSFLKKNDLDEQLVKMKKDIFNQFVK